MSLATPRVAVFVTCGLSVLLVLLPAPGALPSWVGSFGPEWVLLFVFFWAKYADGRVGLIGAWVLGLVTDVVTYSPLGLHALCLCGVVLVVSRTEGRSRLPEDGKEFLLLAILVVCATIIKTAAYAIIQQAPVDFLGILGTPVGSLVVWLPIRDTLKAVLRRVESGL